ncbi:hypothetical protein D3C84_1006450 [compost metagenome]
MSTKKTTIPCMMPESGDVAPFLILVAVRAIAPVAGIPPKRGVTMFAMPCPISSRLLLWRVPVIPSATTADSKDSIPPSIAIISAG